MAKYKIWCIIWRDLKKIVQFIACWEMRTYIFSLFQLICMCTLLCMNYDVWYRSKRRGEIFIGAHSWVRFLLNLFVLVFLELGEGGVEYQSVCVVVFIMIMFMVAFLFWEKKKKKKERCCVHLLSVGQLPQSSSLSHYVVCVTLIFFLFLQV